MIFRYLNLLFNVLIPISPHICLQSSLNDGSEIPIMECLDRIHLIILQLKVQIYTPKTKIQNKTCDIYPG
jgi:hypothetical protein